MNYFKFITFLSLVFIFSCKGNEKIDLEISKIEGKRIQINDSLEPLAAIEKIIKPYKKNLNKTLNAPLAYNLTFLSKNDGDLNTALGNLMADAVMEQVNPIIKKRTGRNIDLVLLNHGGIRSDLPAGDISVKSAYNLMPFENEIIVAELTGEQVKEMLKYLEKAKRAHPVSGIKIKAKNNYRIVEATIQGRKIMDDSTYYIATSDYLFYGGDNMKFFNGAVNSIPSDYKLRNVLIDYFTKTDTIRSQRDNRYTRE